VLGRPCPECGLDTASFEREQIPGLIAANAAAWPPLLTGPDVARRPRTDKWSSLEYACHGLGRAIRVTGCPGRLTGPAS
jgi:hypothetical protein